MSIKTPKRLVLAVIASLVFAPFAAIAPASAVDNRAITIVSTTPATTNVLNPGLNVTADILVRTGPALMVTGDTVSFTMSLTVPTGSAVTLANRDGLTATASDPVYNNTGLPAYFTDRISASGGQITLTMNGTGVAGVPAFTEFDPGNIQFVPDVVGDYVFTLNSTDKDGNVIAGASVTRTFTIVSPTTTVGTALNVASRYELVTRGTDSISTATVGLCYITERPSTATDAGRDIGVEQVWQGAAITTYSIRTTTNLSNVTDGDLRLTITGPAVWVTADAVPVADFSITNSLRVMTIEGGSVNSLVDNSEIDFTVTGIGDITISIQEVPTSGSAARSGGSFSLSIVDKCSNNVYDADESGVRLQKSNTVLTAAPIADEAGASTVARGGTGFIALFLADANGDTLNDATNVVTATSTAAVNIGYGATGTSASAERRGADASTAVFYVSAATTGAVLTATVEIKLNGTLVATKTISFTGEAATLEISAKKISVATSATTAEAFKVRVKDSAGNGVTSGAASVLTYDGTYVTGATAAAASATAASAVSVTCSALRGKGSVTLAWGRLGDKREVVEIICAGGIASFEVTTNKTAYDRAEIGVLSITAKDLSGNPVPDGTDLATAAGKIQFTGSGATLAKTPAATDEFVDGKIDYAFTTSATAGSYNFALWHGDLSPAVTKIAAFTVNAAVVAPTYTKPTLKSSVLAGRVLLFGACEADEGDMVVYVKSPGGAWNEKAKTLECVAGEYDGSVIAPKATRLYRVKQEGTGLWSGSALVRP